MFVCNFKMNRKKLLKLIIAMIFLCIIGIIIFSFSSVFKSGVQDEPQTQSNILEITAGEYTRFLKSAHENIDDYVGITVKITGYVYRMPDFGRTEFVLSRTMILNDSNSAVVVGILSQCENASDYKDGDWVCVTGTIIRGNYKGEMPVLQINEINRCEKPEDEFVYPPSDEKSI